MTSTNGHKPPPDPALLTPNDWRRMRRAFGDQDPEDYLATGHIEDSHQLLIFAYKLRDDPEFTWVQAGDIPPGEVLDFTGGQSPPDPSPGNPAGTSGGSPSRRGSRPSAKRR